MSQPVAKFLLVLTAPLWFGNALAQERHHPHFPADVDAFHAVLAPIWHARPGKARTNDACAQAGRMATLAGEIRSADATALSAMLATLQTQCRSKRAGVDGAFHDVHEAFHRLIDSLPAH